MRGSLVAIGSSRILSDGLIVRWNVAAMMVTIVIVPMITMMLVINVSRCVMIASM